MTMLTINAPVITDEQRAELEEMWGAQYPFELVIWEKKREIGRGPLHIPRWPKSKGEVMRSTGPTVILNTRDHTNVTAWSIFAYGEEKIRESISWYRQPELNRDDKLSCMVNIIGA